MKPLKILLASETYPPDTNGAAMFVKRLAGSLSQIGHRVAAVVPSPEFKDREEHKSRHFSVFRLKSIPLKFINPYFRAVSKINLQKKVNDIISNFKPDIIHIHNHFLIGRACLTAAKKLNIPIIGTNHFMPANLTEYFPKILEKKVSVYMWKDFLKIYNQLDFVTAPSKAAVKMIVDLGLTVPTMAISNGINLKSFSPQKVEKSFYKRYKINAKVPIFLFVGRIEKDKNIDLLLRALNIVLKKKKAQLVIVGRGRDEKIFKKLAKSLNLGKNVIFTGKMPEKKLKKFYNSADVYVAPGSAELQGIAVMEAMASGLPVLALNAVALPELVKNNINGFLFNLDEHNLADKMLKITANKNKLKSMAAKSRLLIQKHSQPKIIKKFERLYRKIIAKKSLEFIDLTQQTKNERKNIQ